MTDIGCWGVSCFQRLQIYHDYQSDYLAIREAYQSVDPCQSIVYALIRAVVTLNNRTGNTMDEIFAEVNHLCPERFSEATLKQGFQQAVRAGVFFQLRPVTIVCGQTLGPARFTFDKNLDRQSSNASYMKYLLTLVGGPTNYYYFEPYCVNPTPKQFDPYSSCGYYVQA